MKKKRNAGKTYFHKIIFALVIVNLLPTMALLYYLRVFYGKQQTEILNVYEARLDSLSYEYDYSFSTAQDALLSLGLKSIVGSAVKMERDAVHFQTFNSVRQELQSLEASRSYIRDVYLYSSSRGWVMSRTSFKDFDTQTEVLYHQLSDHAGTSFWMTVADTLYLCKRIPLNSLSGDGMLVIEFDPDFMNRDILKNQEFEGVLWILDENGSMLLETQGSEMIREELREASGRQFDNELNAVVYTIGKEEYLVLDHSSAHFDWTYVIAVSMKEISGKLRQIQIFMILLVVTLIVTECILIYLFSLSLYTPYDQIDHIVRNMVYPESLRQGGRELSEIPLSDRVRIILQNNQQMRHRLHDLEKDKQYQFLRKVYQGEEVAEEAAAFEENGFHLGNPENRIFFAMALRYLDNFENENDRDIMMFAIMNVVNELNDSSHSFPIINIGSVMYCIYFVNEETYSGAEMKMQMQAMLIKTTVDKYIRRRIGIGISRGFVEIHDMEQGIRESYHALQDSIGKKDSISMFCPDYTLSENAKAQKARSYRTQLLHFIDLGEPQACRKELDNYVDAISDFHYYMVKLEICELVSDVLAVYGNYALTPDYDNIREIIDLDISGKISNHEILKQYLWEYLIHPLFAVICQTEEERDDIQKVLRYISDNLETDMNLAECAEHFNYNVNYMSRWFKAKTGMTYTDYVTNKKIELCKERLLNSDISVNELAELYGYSSPQNFIRVFKKYTLMTPGQFRKVNKTGS